MSTWADLVIDVSHWNGDIDWSAIAAAGIRLVLIKASEGTADTDPSFAKYATGARAAGLAVAPYHFLTGDDPAAQAAHFAGVARLEPGMPYMLDWERTGYVATAAQVEAVGAALGAIVGRGPLGYWGIPGSSPATPTAAMKKWDRMVPRYRQSGETQFSDVPVALRDPGAPFLFWQYTETGVVPGISGNVDRSVFAGDEAALDAWIAGKKPAVTVQQPVPPAPPQTTATLSPAPTPPPVPTESDPATQPASETAEDLNQAELDTL